MSCLYYNITLTTCLIVRCQCVGADVVFDQLGLDVEMEAPDNQLGSIASLVFLRFLEGTLTYFTALTFDA